MIYVDTSVLVALYTHEQNSGAVSRWYSDCTDDLISAAWCVTEFASALSIKQRTRQIDAAGAQRAWQQFERLCINDLHLLPVEPTTFHRAAILSMDPASGLRAGDALHLAAALEAKAKDMVTLEETLGSNASRMKIKLVSL